MVDRHQVEHTKTERNVLEVCGHGSHRRPVKSRECFFVSTLSNSYSRTSVTHQSFPHYHASRVACQPMSRRSHLVSRSGCEQQQLSNSPSFLGTKIIDHDTTNQLTSDRYSSPPGGFAPVHCATLLRVSVGPKTIFRAGVLPRGGAVFSPLPSRAILGEPHALLRGRDPPRARVSAHAEYYLPRSKTRKRVARREGACKTDRLRVV